jgi:DNA replication and repair protein RecF
LKTLLVTGLRLRDVRNVRSLSISPAPRFNVIAGDNGQGKTSLLEALYCVATSRSFRTERLKEMRREGAEFARVDVDLMEEDQARTQRVTVSDAGRAVFCDEQRAERLADYAVRTPMVVFHPGDLELTMGGATRRRDLLDRIGLFSDPAAADDRSRYRLALRERQKVLEVRGERAPELDAYEQLVARHGARLGQIRERASQALSREAEPAFRRLVASNLAFAMRYRSGGELDEARFREELLARRSSDRRRHTATFGPHKDDLELSVDGRPARKHASQGQHRILTLTLKLAELAAIREARGAHPILLLDDVSSELDPTRTGAVFDYLSSSPSQVFVTTTRPELFHTPGASASDRRDYVLESGALRGDSSAAPGASKGS